MQQWLCCFVDQPFQTTPCFLLGGRVCCSCCIVLYCLFLTASSMCVYNFGQVLCAAFLYYCCMYGLLFTTSTLQKVCSGTVLLDRLSSVSDRESGIYAEVSLRTCMMYFLKTDTQGCKFKCMHKFLGKANGPKLPAELRNVVFHPDYM